MSVSLQKEDVKEGAMAAGKWKEPELDGAIFFIYNKIYSHARIAQFGTKSRNIGTYELKKYPDQLWRLVAEPNHPGYYNICNVHYDGYRIAKWGDDDESVGNYNGKFYEDQLWQFHKCGDFYRIFNYRYRNAKITKWGREDDQWGTYAGPDYDDQLWKLVPIFQSTLVKKALWQIDNRDGTHDIKRELSVKSGLKITQKSPVVREKISNSVKFSASIAIENLVQAGMETNTEFALEMEKHLGADVEKDRIEETKDTFTAPKKRNYRVTQWHLDFRSGLENENIHGLVYTDILKIEETEGEFKDDAEVKEESQSNVDK